MPKKFVLVTGACGEMGASLLKELSARRSDREIVAVDLVPLADDQRKLVHSSYLGSVLDRTMLDGLSERYPFETIFHLAAVLSARGEGAPDLAHQVNVEGTLNVLRLAHAGSSRHNHPVRVVFPSSIAVYGIPPSDRQSAAAGGPLREEQWNYPVTMYGCNKLYCEHLGRYFTSHARQGSPGEARLDFRTVRLPGLLSADTLPSGGTSDFAPEMIHAAARGTPYRCFVGPEAKIPFMVMPDAVRALVQLADAERADLSSSVYNVAAFSVSAGEIAERLRRAFASAKIAFCPDPERASIVASWPEAIDDARARADWGWSPAYDWERALSEYLVPRIVARYARNESLTE